MLRLELPNGRTPDSRKKRPPHPSEAHNTRERSERAAQGDEERGAVGIMREC